MGLDFIYQLNQTPLDEDEKQGLKINSITTQQELDEFEQLNIEKALEWVIDKKLTSEKILTEKFVKDLHQKMYGDIWKWAGKFRKSEKNIGIKWQLIGIELKNLLGDTKYWIANQTFSPQEISIRFKHRLVAIHCFPNGNGRHSRVMADIIIEDIFKAEIFSWQKSNMVKADQTRKKYIAALKEADIGNINPLIKFAKN
jgi:Fic-DOC domain mobile mystery protein B